MESLLIAVPAAFWLGLLTSISPCPLAANIAAVSYIGKETENTRRACWAGVLYTTGRSVSYAFLGAVISFSMLSAPFLSDFLQRRMNSILGPVLILVGMVLLGLLQFGLKGSKLVEELQKKAVSLGLAGALFLGVLFAASFCPVSAALFFGSLVPLSVKAESSVLVPAIYGIGTGVPVLAFALLISFGLTRLNEVYGKVVSFEKYARIGTGAIFLLVGLYYSLVYIFGLSL
jgi:cytochrome c-type biogenesis protein